MENSEDAGYSYSLEKGLRKRSSSEKEEDEYLAELKNKDQTELSILKKAAARQAVKDIGKSASKSAVSGVMAVGKGMEAGIDYSMSSEAAKYEVARVKGALNYLPSQFASARKNYEADVEARNKFKDAYRESKKESAVKRGVLTEQRHYTQKVRKETEKQKREEARRDIEISAEKAYHTERAKTAGRIAAREARQEARQQYVVVGQPPRRRQWAGPVWQKSPYRTATADEIDPFHIYHFQPQQQTVPNSRVDLSHMHSLLGYSPNRTAQPAQATPKVNSDFAQKMLGFNQLQQSQQDKPKVQSNKAKRRKFNLFTAQFEWQ